MSDLRTWDMWAVVKKSKNTITGVVSWGQLESPAVALEQGYELIRVRITEQPALKES